MAYSSFQLFAKKRSSLIFQKSTYSLRSLEMPQADLLLVFLLRVAYIKEILYSLLSVTRMSCWGGKDVKSGVVVDLV